MSDNPLELSRIYRAAADETPPPALDAAILAAARARVARPTPRRRGWWARLMVPASLVATLVLGVSVSLRMVQERPESVTGSPAVSETAAGGTATPPAPEAKPQRGSVDHLVAEREVRAPSAPAAKPKVAPPMDSAPPATAARPAIAPSPAAAIKQEEAAMPSAEANRSAPASAVPAERRAAAGEAKRNQADMADAAASESSVAVPSPNVAGAAPAAKAARAPAHAPSPADWIERIRRLKREGREDEAARQLAEFRRAYPDFSVPDDLRSR